MNLEQFTQILKDYLEFSHKGSKLHVKYQRDDSEATNFTIWLQKYLDELGITYFEFVYTGEEVVIRKYLYESPLGEIGFPPRYEIILKDDSKGFYPENIKSAILNFW